MQRKQRAVSLTIVLAMLVCLFSQMTERADAISVSLGSTVEVIFDSNAPDGHVGTLNGEAQKTKTISSIEYGASVEQTPAYRPKCIFLGWYTDPWDGERVTAETATIATHVYAHWECGFDVVNRQFDFSQVFFNAFRRGEYSTFNFGTCRIFADGNGKNTWCSDAAFVELMNRALAYDGLLRADYFYDIRDILTANCNNNGWVAGMSVSAMPRCFSAYNNVGGSGGEKLNNDGVNSRKSLDIINAYGSRNVDPTTYTVTFDYTLQKTRWKGTNKDYIARLLSKHPEGLWIRVAHSHKAGSHCFIIAGYDEKGFLYIDNGNCNRSNGSTGIVRYNQLYDHFFASEDDMLNNYTLVVGYVER
ncbi:MAG: hypothetical protein J5645_00250 [Lachnospiraceae bacterium]|nr:hypothetical protein [Lachnospiraceae bacterium]